MELEMREVAPTDIEKIIAFHNSVYKDDRKREQWEWEYRGNYPDSSVFTVVTDTENIIATQGMIPYFINIRGKRVLTGKSENTLLDPKYRGGNLFKEFYDFTVSLCEEKGMKCIWGYTSAKKAFERFGFLVYEDVMYNSISVLRLWQTLSSLLVNDSGILKRGIRFLIFPLFWVYSLIFRSFNRFLDKGFIIKEELSDKQDLNNLYKRLQHRYPDLINIELDDIYLQWRICNHPVFKYKTFFVYEGELLRAYAFVNMHYGYKAYLIDFTFEIKDAGKFLLKKILRKMRAERTGYVVFWGNGINPAMKVTFNLLKRFGFVQSRSNLNFVLRNLSFEEPIFLSGATNWYMNGLWTEGFRM